ncbi:alpha/beta hydrolase [Nonomuraea sp. PA05]|uniref:alpha/beta fold hydrolase n=1 Tax=Nonomuraea sp. PA05 TaxID=2604466 RepID=UPI0011D7BF97|nr:alpha/beta fold hydrolase [Nonomuraea sp. PA05]TYB65995.1 alpha/beta hydrolase [Nonomuraea sp. PA05]
MRLFAIIALAGTFVATPAAAQDTLRWGPCEGPERPQDLRCSTVQVPVDWARPGGRKITIKVAKLPATGRSEGTVFSVPGGPGVSGIDDLTGDRDDFTKLRERFDVVSLEPRNAATYGLLPRECFTTGPWITPPRTRAEYARLGATIREGALKCRNADPAFYDNFNSASVARDIDAIRAALGERRLSFLATSYGGVTAVTYARLFPQRLRAVYLDGVINQLRDTTADARARFEEGEEQFGRFVEWCASVRDVCGPGDMGARWRKLVATADRTPLPVEGDSATYTGFDLQTAAMPNLRTPGPAPEYPRWRQLAQAIRQAEAGNAGGFAKYIKAGTGSPKLMSPVAMNMTHCADGLRYRDYREYQAVRAMGEKLSPNLAGTGVWHRLGCVGWPTPVKNPAGPLPAGLPPFLGAGTWGDYASTADIVRRVPGSATVRYDGHGHGLYLSGDACTIAHANAYLMDLRLPAPGTTCRPTTATG